jgi:hypothetical protein
MKAKPLKISSEGYVECTATEAEYIKLKFPSPANTIILPVITKGKREGTNAWTWNGKTDFPTLMPSIRTQIDKPSGLIICHSWVKNGKVQFLSDSTHKNAGKTLDLLEVDD